MASRLRCPIVTPTPNIPQGTAFHIEGDEFITSAHFLPKEREGARPRALRLYRGGEEIDPADCRIIAVGRTMDVARVRRKETTIDVGGPEFGLRVSELPSFAQRPEICIAGFPYYQGGDSVYMAEGKVEQIRRREGVTHHTCNARIVQGISGGPVMRPNGDVVGVAVIGETDTRSNEFLSIGRALNDLVDLHGEYRIVPVMINVAGNCLAVIRPGLYTGSLIHNGKV